MSAKPMMKMISHRYFLLLSLTFWFCLILPSAAGLATEGAKGEEVAGGGGNRFQIVVASELATIPGWLRGGNFRLELAPAGSGPEDGDMLRADLHIELQPDFGASASPPPTPPERILIDARGLISSSLYAHYTSAAFGAPDTPDAPGAPAVSGAHGVSGVSGVSDTPDTSGTPVTPGTPDTSGTSETPDAPDALTDASAVIRLEFARHPAITLQAVFSLKRDHSNPSQLRATLALSEIILPRDQALLTILPGWPPQLNLEEGRINFKCNLTSTPQGLSGSGRLALNDANGIYDTAFFRGLNAEIPFTLEPSANGVEPYTPSRQETPAATNGAKADNPSRQESLAATTGQGSAVTTTLAAKIEVEIDEFNPGIAIQPVRVSASYRAPINALGQGELKVHQLEAELLNGRVWAPAATALPEQVPSPTMEKSSLKSKPIPPERATSQSGTYPKTTEQPAVTPTEDQITLQVEGIDLTRILEIHPVEGLMGKGVIDGFLPLYWGPEGFYVGGGHLEARNPGGMLRYGSSEAAALAQRNPTLKLVLDALADFHYNILRAGVEYQKDGTLNLALRLEGANPAFEGGRTILLDLNLEENIPALLASLQLGNRISDTIRKRIEEQYR